MKPSTKIADSREHDFAAARNVLRSETGSALVELALVLSLLGVPLILGTSELGLLAYDSIEVSNAAHAAAMHGMQSSTLAADTAGMRTAAQTEASDFGATLTVTPTSYYACSNALGGTQFATQSAATSVCSGGSNHPLQFVQVKVSVPVTPPIHCPGLASTFTLTGTSVMEVEE